MGCLVVTCREVQLNIGNVSHDERVHRTGCMDLESRDSQSEHFPSKQQRLEEGLRTRRADSRMTTGNPL